MNMRPIAPGKGIGAGRDYVFQTRADVLLSLSRDVTNLYCRYCGLASPMLLYYSKLYDYLSGSRTSIFFTPHVCWVVFNLNVMKYA